MRINQDTIRDALKLARADKRLYTALHEWWQMQGTLPTSLRGKPFGTWLIDMLNEMSTTIDGIYHGEQTSQNIVDALRVNAIGDVLALKLSDEAAKDGFGTDTNCYVEDGCVDANVYLHSDDPKRTKKRADEIRDKFIAAGYSAEVWVDEEDDRDATVNAALDFKLYVKPNQNMVK